MSSIDQTNQKSIWYWSSDDGVYLTLDSIWYLVICLGDSSLISPNCLCHKFYTRSQVICCLNPISWNKYIFDFQIALPDCRKASPYIHDEETEQVVTGRDPDEIVFWRNFQFVQTATAPLPNPSHISTLLNHCRKVIFQRRRYFLARLKRYVW